MKHETNTAEAGLFAAYEEWRRIAEIEGQAIRARNWTAAADCHTRLRGLQSRITRLASEARKEWRDAGADVAAKEQQLREMILDLIEIEKQNNAFLAAARETATRHLEQLNCARKNLKRVQRSYSPSRPPIWNSFS